MDVVGNFTLLVSVHHDGDYFGVNVKDDVMVFGNETDYEPELVISGASLNDEAFTADSGRIEFRHVEFAATAPKWIISGVDIGVVVAGSMLADGLKNDVPNDIEMERYSRLEVGDDQTFNGKLWMKAKDTKIQVADETTATFVAP